MENPHENAPFENISRSPTFAAPPLRASQGVEWVALAAGFGAEVAWWIFHNLFNALILSRLLIANPSITSAWWIGPVFLLVSLGFALARGSLIGFVVGYFARHHHYRFAVISMIVNTILGLLLSMMLSALSYWPSLRQIWLTVVLSFIISLAAAVNGAYLAQSYKRNRNVRIT